MLGHKRPSSYVQNMQIIKEGSIAKGALTFMRRFVPVVPAQRK